MHSMGGLLQDKLKEKLRIFNSIEENLDLFSARRIQSSLSFE